MRKIGALAKSGDWWVLSGSLPPGIAPRFYADAIEMIQGAGAFAVLDADGEALRLGCGARPWLIKPNAEEASRLTGACIESPQDAAQAMPVIHALAAQQVVVSLGAGGAVSSDGTGTCHAASPAIRERNPIGAGDALLGGMVWRMSRGDSLAESLRWGVACGAAAASLDGTAVGTRMQVEQIAARVRVRSLSAS